MRLTHARFGGYLKDAVYGANDGIITTFAVVAAVAGAALSPITIIIVGLANLFADGFSMAVSNYLGMKSNEALYMRERAVEEQEIREVPKEEEGEVRDILMKKGYSGDDLGKMASLVMKNKKFWVDLMMSEELGFSPISEIRPVRSAFITFVSFVCAGFLPIVPYVFLGSGADMFLWAFVATASALFLVGALRSFFTGRQWIASGFEMFFIGGIAAGIAYGVGYAVGGVI